jgi:integrase
LGFDCFAQRFVSTCSSNSGSIAKFDSKTEHSGNVLFGSPYLRARSLMLLLLYSGLRISDAMQVERNQLKPDGRLLVRIMKTGKPLYVRLHADCLDALKALPVESEHFLWSGIGKLSSAVGSARRSVAMIGKLARVKDVHPHRFRDTFSVELLVKTQKCSKADDIHGRNLLG